MYDKIIQNMTSIFQSAMESTDVRLKAIEKICSIFRSNKANHIEYHDTLLSAEKVATDIMTDTMNTGAERVRAAGVIELVAETDSM